MSLHQDIHFSQSTFQWDPNSCLRARLERPRFQENILLSRIGRSPSGIMVCYTITYNNIYHIILRLGVFLHKKPCLALLTAMFYWQKPMYQSGNSRAVDAWLLYFTYTHSRPYSMPAQKMTSSTVTCLEMNAI